MLTELCLLWCDVTEITMEQSQPAVDSNLSVDRKQVETSQPKVIVMLQLGVVLHRFNCHWCQLLLQFHAVCGSASGCDYVSHNLSMCLCVFLAYLQLLFL